MNEQSRATGQTEAAPIWGRRTFLKAGAVAALAAALPGTLRAADPSTNSAADALAQSAAEAGTNSVFKGDAKKLVWGNLVHLTRNLWCDWDSPTARKDNGLYSYSPEFRFDDKLWDETVSAMSAAGVNLVLLDLGDAVKFKSHPEIALKDAWTVKRLKTELARLRKLGIEPIPKFNLSATHNTWLGPYRHMVSSDKYNTVVRELIAEVCALFDRPRFFHLGMDEEDAGLQCQYDYQYVVARRGDLWWHDFYGLVDDVEKHGARAWIWSDIYGGYRDDFAKRMPKSVVQSFWYYGPDFSEKKGKGRIYREIAEKGYDSIPTAGIYYGGANTNNLGRTVDYCTTHLPPERLLGFLQTTWQPTQMPYRSCQLEVIAQVKTVREKLIASQSATTAKAGS
jgi:hypothetical protein